MISIIVMLLVTYFIPAFLCTWLTYFFRSRPKFFPYRKTILSVGLTIGWAPGVITAGHGAFIGQLLAILIFSPPKKFDWSEVFFDGVVLAITLLIVLCAIRKFKLDR